MSLQARLATDGEPFFASDCMVAGQTASVAKVSADSRGCECGLSGSRVRSLWVASAASPMQVLLIFV